jgi:uncharacterized protein (TIGR02145 family)
MNNKNRLITYTFILLGLIIANLFSCTKDESIIKKNPIITWTNPADIRSGTLLSTTQLNATADVAGTFVYTPAIGTQLNAGANQNLKADFTPTDDEHYNTASKTVKINVNAKQDPIITWANPADISSGTLLSATQLNATADVPGVFIYTPAIGTKLDIGTDQNLKVDFTPTDLVNYNTASKTVKINVTATSAFGTVTDADGNVYHTINIGTQTWMAENLKYLPSVVGPGTGSETTPYYYVYGYNGTNIAEAKATANYATYGVLYNWPAAMAGSASSTANPSGVQGVCPTGWHLPSDDEWTTLIAYLEGANIAGGKLKETGTTHWSTPNTGATNEIGFTALPSGVCYANGSFDYVGFYGFWWSSTEYTTAYAWYRNVAYGNANLYRVYDSKRNGISVRCVKN